jgi:hypothetical protein
MGLMAQQYTFVLQVMRQEVADDVPLLIYQKQTERDPSPQSQSYSILRVIDIGIIVNSTKNHSIQQNLNHRAFLVKARESLLVVVFVHEQNKTQFEL